MCKSILFNFNCAKYNKKNIIFVIILINCILNFIIFFNFWNTI